MGTGKHELASILKRLVALTVALSLIFSQGLPALAYAVSTAESETGGGTLSEVTAAEDEADDQTDASVETLSTTEPDSAADSATEEGAADGTSDQAVSAQEDTETPQAANEDTSEQTDAAQEETKGEVAEEAPTATSRNASTYSAEAEESGDELDEATLLELSENGELTAEVLDEAPNSRVDTETIGLKWFTFKASGGSAGSEAIKEKAADGKTLQSGSAGSLFNSEITIDLDTYIFEGITIDGVEVSYIGTIKLTDPDTGTVTTYIYYLAGEPKGDATVYKVLKEKDEFTVTYGLGNEYKIAYEIQDEYGTTQSSVGNYDADDVFGANRVESLYVTDDSSSEEDSYTINVSIPRGYKATVSVYNLGNNGEISGEAIESLPLGKMMKYGSSTSGGTVGLEKDSPDSIQLSGTITVDNVKSNQKVILKYEEYNEFTFSAATWLTTPNAGGGVSNGSSERLEDISITVGSKETNVNTSSDAKASFEPGDTVIWTFTGRTTEGQTWLLNHLRINGEYINIPLLAATATDSVSAKTALSTGTEVTVTAKNNNSAAWGTNGKTTTYTVTITNCYEDVTVSEGNMASHSNQEFSIDSVVGASNLQVFYKNASEDGWKNIGQSNREEFRTANKEKLVFQYTHDAGYFLPNVTVKDINGNPIDGAIRYLKLKAGKSAADLNAATNWSDVFEEVSYSEIVQESDGTYFFMFSDKATNNLNKYVQLHVYIEAKYMNFKVEYEGGVDASDTPSSSDITGVPATDDNNSNYYNVVNDNIVSISTSIPTDQSGNYAFAGWQVKAVGGGVIKDSGGSPIILQAGSYLDLTEVLHDWLHKGINHPASQEDPAYFTLVATWEKTDSAEVVNYVVSYILDGETIKANRYTANKGASLVFNAYLDDGKTFTNDLQSILKGDNNNSDDYTSEGNVSIVLSKVAVGSDEYTAGELAGGGILVDSLNGTTVIRVYLSTMIPVNYTFVSGTKDMVLPTEITTQLENAMAVESVATSVAYSTKSDAKVSNELATYSFVKVEDEKNDGVWTFNEWDEDSVSMPKRTESVTFTGTWVFEANEYKVEYEFVDADGDEITDEDILALLPTDGGSHANGADVTLKEPAATSVDDRDNDGTWTFQGTWTGDYEGAEAIKAGGTYKMSKDQAGGDSKVTFTGTWVFKANTYEVEYEFVDADGDEITDEDILALLPTDGGSYANGADVNVSDSPKVGDTVEASDGSGTWTFQGWDKDSATIDGEGVTFTGTWVFTANEDDDSNDPDDSDDTTTPDDGDTTPDDGDTSPDDPDDTTTDNDDTMPDDGATTPDDGAASDGSDNVGVIGDDSDDTDAATEGEGTSVQTLLQTSDPLSAALVAAVPTTFAGAGLVLAGRRLRKKDRS